MNRIILLVDDEDTLRQVVAHQREIMLLVQTADAQDALHRLLVADMAAERVAGVGRIGDHPSAPDDLHRLADKA